MDSNELTREQVEAIHRAIGPTLRYLQKVERRMEKTGFPTKDKLFVLTVDTVKAMHHLCIELHYLSCRGGVGRPPK